MSFLLETRKGLKTMHNEVYFKTFTEVFPLSNKNVRVKIDEMKTNVGLIKNLELSIGKVVDDSWTEPMGPTPLPSMSTLRDWDFKLLEQVQTILHAGL